MHASENHGARRRRSDRRAHGRADIEPAMELRLGRPGRDAAAVARVDLAAHGPAGGQRRQHASGATEEALEGAEVVALFLDDARQPVELVADGGTVGRLGNPRRAGTAADAGSALGGAVFGAEGLPDPGVQLAPAVDLGADLTHLRLRGFDDSPLLRHARREVVERGALAAQLEIVGVDEGDRNGSDHEESECRQDQPPGKGHTGDAPPVVVDHEKVELARRPHDPQRLMGTTERSREGSTSVLGLALVIRQWPSKSTPSSTTTTGASTSPKTRAVRLSSMRSAAETLPTTSPLTSTCPARISPLITPLSPMISISVVEISPLNRPFSMTVPLKVYFPSISEPSSMKAVRPLLPAGFRLRLNMAGPRAGNLLPYRCVVTARAPSTRCTGRGPTAAASPLLLTTLPLKKPPLEITSESVSMLPVTRPVSAIATLPVATMLPSYTPMMTAST